MYGVEAAKKDLAHIIKFCYKNASRLNRYNLPMVKAIHFLFSTLLTTPFLYASVATSDTPLGSNPQYLSAGKFNSLQIWFIRRGILYLLICPVR